MSDTPKILVGKIVAAQGLSGEVRVQTFTESPDDFQKLRVQSSKFQCGDLKFVRRLNPTSDVIIAKISGVTNRTVAEELRETELYVTRDALPSLTDGEYYHTDLIGMIVETDNEPIGMVVAIHNFGAGDIIELDSGEMISFVGADVDIENKKIKI